MRKLITYYLPFFFGYLLIFLCFPFNPLVFMGLIEPNPNDFLSVTGFIIWGFGMYLVVYPIFYFKNKGEVRKGNPYIKTNKLVKTGFYSIIRHVKYTGGIISIFLTTPFFIPALDFYCTWNTWHFFTLSFCYE